MGPSVRKGLQSFIFLLALIQAASGGPSSPPTTLPLINGDFETGPFDTLGTVTGWTVSGNGKALSTTQGATSGTHSAALGAVGDSQDNVLSQSFVTIPGGIYSLDFDTGVAGVNFNSPMQLHVQVIGSNSLIDQILTPYYAGTNNPDRVIFVHYHYTFIADSTATTLQFSDISASNAGADIEVDSVSVALHVTKGPATYTAKDLGAAAGLGNAINIYGQITGQTDGGHAYLSAPNGGPLTDLGTLGGSSSSGSSVNQFGQVAGNFTTANNHTHGFLSAPNGGGLTDLGTFNGAALDESRGFGVNDSGQVTGYSIDSNRRQHASLSGPNGGPLIDIGTINNDIQSLGSGVNASGQVCGSGTVNGESHAFLSGPNGGPLKDLGTLGGIRSFAQAVNASGQAVGTAFTGQGKVHVFRTGPNGNNLTDISLGYDDISAYGINSCGQVVGTVVIAASTHALIYNSTGGVKDLNPQVSPLTGWTLVEANGISDQGQIVAWGTRFNQEDTFLLTPNLGIELADNNNVTLFWPGSCTGPAVQETTALGPNTNWQDVTTQPTVVDGTYSFTASTSGDNSAHFYRLTFITGSQSQQQLATRPNQRDTVRANRPGRTKN
ncbi:MAG: hypothetical protein ACJ8M1_15240 [Chthoniobacterales bacterium]